MPPLRQFRRHRRFRAAVVGAEICPAATAAAFGWLPARFEREATAILPGKKVPASESSQTARLYPHPLLGPADLQEDGKREG